MKWYKHIVFFFVMTIAAWSATDITDGYDLPENALGGGYMTSNGLVGSAAGNTFLAFSFTGGTEREACTQDHNDDWGGAFNGDICLGARQWDTSGYINGLCEITDS